LAKTRAFKVTLKCWTIHTSFAKRRARNTAVVAMVMLSNREPNNQTPLLCVPIAVKGNCAGFTNPAIRVVFQQSPSTNKTTCCMRVLAGGGEGEVNIDLRVVTL
jgi:hypothetical protein